MTTVQKAAESRKATEKERKAQQLGFSLLEVLVAITILAVGLLALARMQTQAVSSNSFGNQLTKATFLAQDKAEELRLLNKEFLANPLNPEPNAIKDSDSTNWTGTAFDWTVPENTETVGAYTREWNVVDNVPVVKAKTIHVRVSWVGSDKKSHQVTVETILSQ